MNKLFGDEKPCLEDLAHHGVKGMRWGVRKANRQQQRQLNRESKARDNAAIDAARDRISSGGNRQRYLDAKKQYKEDKKTIGRREAKKKLDVVKMKNMSDAELANTVKHGSETAAAILGVVGGAAASAFIGSRLR